LKKVIDENVAILIFLYFSRLFRHVFSSAILTCEDSFYSPENKVNSGIKLIEIGIGHEKLGFFLKGMKTSSARQPLFD
jgi:hypothetical protein